MSATSGWVRAVCSSAWGSSIASSVNPALRTALIPPAFVAAAMVNGSWQSRTWAEAAPKIHLSVGQPLVEVVTDCERVPLAGLVVHPVSDGRGRRRMSHRELYEAPGLEDPADLLECPLRLANVHQAHECRGEVEGRASEWEVGAVAEDESDAAGSRQRRTR